MTSWTLTIPSVTPSLNETRRMHWAARKRADQVLGWEVVSALNRVPPIPKATGKRRMTICRHGRKALDQDNLAGGCKGLIDFIKLRGLLVDDSPTHVELVFTQQVTRTGPIGTTIVLEDVA
jgi:hypothetical protein